MMRVFTGVFLMAMLLTTLAIPVQGQEAAFTVGSSDTVKSVLERHVGKEVILRLASGPDMQGTVTKVGDNVVHISKLSVMNYYDAVVRLEGITAVMVKARGRQ